MSQYVCQICGYVYDEEKGIPEAGIVPGTKWEQLPSDWKCPLCGTEKSLFEKKEEQEAQKKAAVIEEADEELHEINAGELSAVCSNLARGCEKQYRTEEAALFAELAKYYAAKTAAPEEADLQILQELVRKDLEQGLPTANAAAKANEDRGAKRVLTWSEKVTRLTEALLERYASEGADMLKDAKIWVCDICGFIYIGKEPPTVCPICKVPSMKILEVK
jgi:rubredoxin